MDSISELIVLVGGVDIVVFVVLCLQEMYRIRKPKVSPPSTRVIEITGQPRIYTPVIRELGTGR